MLRLGWCRESGAPAEPLWPVDCGRPNSRWDVLDKPGSELGTAQALWVPAFKELLGVGGDLAVKLGKVQSVAKGWEYLPFFKIVMIITQCKDYVTFLTSSFCVFMEISFHRHDWLNHWPLALIHPSAPLLSLDARRWDWKFQPSSRLLDSSSQFLLLGSWGRQRGKNHLINIIKHIFVPSSLKKSQGF